MSVIPTVYNQGTGLIGSTTSGAAIPSNIDDLIINDTLLVGGEATFNGAVTVNNTLSVTGTISFQDVTVQGTFILEGKTPTQLAFYTTGGEVTGTADMTYDNNTNVTTMTNVTVTTALSFGALLKSDPSNYPVALHKDNRICIADSPNILTYNPGSGTLLAQNVTVGNNLIVAQDVQVTFGNVNVITGDVTLNNGDITMTSGTLTANVVSADFIRIQPLPSGNPPDQVPLVFCDTTDNNTLKQDTEPLRLSYTPSLNKFHAGNAEINNQLDVLGDANITNNLTVTTGDVTVTAGDVNVTTGTLTVPNLVVTTSANITGIVINLTATNNQAEYDVVLQDRTTGAFVKELDTTHFTYNPFYSRLTVFDINCTDKLTIEQLAGGGNDAEIYNNSLGLLFDQLNGHRFQTNSIDKLRIRPGRVDVYPDFYVTNDLIVNVLDNSDNTNCRVLFIDSNTTSGTVVSNNLFFYNPNNETLRSTNIRVGNTLEIIDSGGNNGTFEMDATYGVFGKSDNGYVFADANAAPNWKMRIGITRTDVYNPLHLADVTVPGTPGFNFPFLLRNQGTTEVKLTSTSGSNAIYCDPATGDLTIAGDLTVEGTIYNNVLPLNYTAVFSTRNNPTGTGPFTYGLAAWVMFNVTGAAGEDTDYFGSNTGRLFGKDNQIMWPVTLSAGGQPRITQYGYNAGADSAIDFKFGASADSGDKFRISSASYAGWWYVDISVLYQNNSSVRDMPYIRLMKQVGGSGNYIEQPQVSQGVEYLRQVEGELTNLVISGPIYFSDTLDNYRIFTLLEQAGNIPSPPTWDNESTNAFGLGLNISLKYLGNANTDGETITIL